ncbi:MAG TPA: hypothetical protein GX527_09515 [Clostridiaceae bacterium]|jgi:hypothetical protein|nr:hypothetical protein [Clostridiaceae bacterium]
MYYKFKLISVCLIAVLFFQCCYITQAYSSDDKTGTDSMNTFGNHNEDQDEEQNENSKQDTVGANVLTLVSKTDKDVEISWTSYGRNDPDTIYEVYRDDVMIASTKDLCFLNVGLTPETTYTYLIISKDNEGYIRSESNKICATTKNHVNPEQFKSIINEKVGEKYIEYIQPDYPIVLEESLISNDTKSLEEDKEKDVISNNSDEEASMDTSPALVDSSNNEFYDNELQNDELSLFPNDPLFEEQWGFFNNNEDKPSASDTDNLIYEMIEPVWRRRHIPPHIIDLLKRIPHFQEAFDSIHEEEIWKSDLWVEVVDAIEQETLDDVPREVIDGLRHDLFFMKYCMKLEIEKAKILEKTP